MEALALARVGLWLRTQYVARSEGQTESVRTPKLCFHSQFVTRANSDRMPIRRLYDAPSTAEAATGQRF